RFRARHRGRGPAASAGSPRSPGAGPALGAAPPPPRPPPRGAPRRARRARPPPHRRECGAPRWTLPEQGLAPAADRPAAESDDTLILLFMCCHPVLSPASQIALTLRGGGGR